jgi:haloacetate dehalogenase
MSDLADLFPTFESHWLPTSEGKIFARSKGSGPPLMLLHGFPQTHVMWHRLAPKLAEHFHVVAMDLRGYGWSSVPRASSDHCTYSKRAMGGDVVAVMEALGHVRFRIIGHDRGARVAYRLALDHPGRVETLALIDILPTAAMWRLVEAPGSNVAPHWRMLSAPPPGPETQIGAAPLTWLESTLAAWTADKDLSAFDRRALAHYRASFNAPERIAAMCEDYRAGATLDRAADDADRAAGRQIQCPTFVIWGSSGFPAMIADPLAPWREYCPDVTGQAVAGGHFLPEENAPGTLAALMAAL